MFFLSYLIQANYATEAISLLLFLEDVDFKLLTLARMIVKQKLHPLVLENDVQLSYLDFDYNTNLTLRSVIRDELYEKLVQTMVRMSTDVFVNILLLDKINRHEEVLRELIRVQREEIERNWPEYWVRGVGRGGRGEEYREWKEGERKIVAVVSEAHAELLNEYEKQELKKRYAHYFRVLIDNLEVIATAFNHIWSLDFDTALLHFSTLSFLPLRASDQPLLKCKDYPNLDPSLKALIFPVVLAIGKLVMHVYYRVVNEAAKTTSGAGGKGMRKVAEIREMLERVVMYLEMLKSGGLVEEERMGQWAEATGECKRIQIEIA